MCTASVRGWVERAQEGDSAEAKLERPPRASTECARPTAEGQEGREGGTQRRACWWQGCGRSQEQWAIGVAGQSMVWVHRVGCGWEEG